MAKATKKTAPATKVPTAAQIKAEVKKLEKMKPTVRLESFFGDNHHDAIDAQIEVLEDGLDMDTIDNRDGEEWKENVASAARDAYYWMTGEDINVPAPHVEWHSLVVKKK
jgi:hypothetical protein